MATRGKSTGFGKLHKITSKLYNPTGLKHPYLCTTHLSQHSEMNRLFTIATLCLQTSVCRGQVMTLRDCIHTGLACNLQLAGARVDTRQAQVGISQNRARLLPLINGVVGLTGYLKSPVNVTTGTPLGHDFPHTPSWQTIKSMPYNAQAGIQLSVPLYDPTILAAVDVARTVEKIRLLDYEKAVENLTMQISRIYYMAQASLEQQRLTGENIIRTEQLCDITEALYNQGVVMEVDLSRVRISLQDLQTQQDQNRTLHSRQLNMLRYLMDMAPETPLEVTPMAEDIAPLPPTGISETLPDLLLPAQGLALAGEQIKAAKAARLPSLSLTAYAGALDYQEKFRHFFQSHTSSDNWFGHSHIGLTVKIPLFEANSTKLKIRQYRLDAEKATIRANQTFKQLSKDYADAVLDFSHNMEAFHTQTENLRLAEEVYHLTEEQYREGVASMTTLLQDEIRLQTAGAAYVQALCGCWLSRLDLLRLTGRLALLSENSVEKTN